MASPQLENGYTPIANEILDKIALLPLNGTQFRIVMIVWRYTYGFSRKEHDLSETFIAQATGIHRKQIQREINNLIKFNIIFVIQQATFKSSRIIAFNKDYDSWLVTKKLPGNELAPGSEIDPGNESVISPGSESVPQDKQDLKTKDLVVIDPPNPPVIKLSNELKEIARAWESNFKLTISSGIAEKLLDWNQNDDMPIELIVEAIKIAAGEGVRKVSYIDGILRDWHDKGIKTLSAVETARKEWIQKKSRDKPKRENGFRNNQKVVNLNGGTGANRGNIANDPIPVNKLIIRANDV